jgi:uncharacterized pyridoxamine 5'-phosphate oxidase family protein
MGTEEICGLLKKAGVWFIATCDGDRPRVRPFSPVHIFEGRLYFMTARSKAVARQLAANPKIEISAMLGEGRWLRISALAVDDDRRGPKASFIEAYPDLAGEHPVDDPDTQVLYLKDATATIESFGGEKRTVTF